MRGVNECFLAIRLLLHFVPPNPHPLASLAIGTLMRSSLHRQKFCDVAVFVVKEVWEPDCIFYTEER